MSAKSYAKKKCQAVASSIEKRCQKFLLCCRGLLKKESLVVTIIAFFLGAFFTMSWDVFKDSQDKDKLQSQIRASLKFEFQDNQTCWEKNYTIVTQDRGALQQEKTEKFMRDNLLWITYRPLCDFSFRAWDYAMTNNSNLLSRLNEDGYMLKEFYGALREIQDYKNEREKHREIKEKNMEKSEIFEDVNQNLIGFMDKHKNLLEKVDGYFTSQMQPSSPFEDKNKFSFNTGEERVVMTEVTGDTVVVTGSTLGAVDTKNIASGITVKIKH